MGSKLSPAKHFINAALHKTGYNIVQNSTIPSFSRLVSHLARAGIAPVTIYDIGIATGTPWLYEAYPKATYFLFDPTPESLPHMEKIAQTLEATIFNNALGASDGTVTLKVRPEHSGSTLFDEVGELEHSRDVEVPMHRFDSQIKTVAKPAMMKIDVQGAEIMVLEGLGERLHDIDCFIIECSVIATLHGGPELAQIVALMASKDFVLYDIINLTRRPLDGALAQVDAVFVPQSSPLRADRRWQTSA